MTWRYGEPLRSLSILIHTSVKLVTQVPKAGADGKIILIHTSVKLVTLLVLSAQVCIAILIHTSVKLVTLPEKGVR